MQPNTRWIAPLLAVFAALPHFGYVHVAVTVYLLLAVGWYIAHHFKSAPLPPNFIRYPIIFSSVGVVLYVHGTPLNVVAATAFLLVTIGAIFLSPKTATSAVLTFTCSGLLIICSAVHGQTIFLTLHIILTFTLMLTFLTTSSDGLFKPTTSQFLKVAKSATYFIPIVILLFIVIPRTSRSFIPPMLNNNAKSGFSDKLDPGSLARLVASNELAFRAKFEPIQSLDSRDIYWRGKTLSFNNGMVWSKGFVPRFTSSNLLKQQIVHKVKILLEPTFRNWLFSLDVPKTLILEDSRWQRELDRGADNSFFLNKDASERLLYHSYSQLKYKQTMSDREMLTYLQMPRRISKRTKELALKLKINDGGEPTNANTFSKNFARYLQENDFTYTLQPGAMSNKTVESFLFSTKRGFCEHYAAVSAYLFREAGIPARVVVGFQGGSLNPVDNFLSVRGKDAHAWIEFYDVSTYTWHRFDATKYIASERIQSGGQIFHENRSGILSKGSALIPERLKAIFVKAQNYLSALSNSYNLFMVSFDFKYQKDFFSKFNIDITKKSLALFLVFLVSAIAICVYLYYNFRDRWQLRNDRSLRLYRKFVNYWQKRDLAIDESTSPTNALKIIAVNYPEHKEKCQKFIDSYICYRYSNRHNSLKQSNIDLLELAKHLHLGINAISARSTKAKKKKKNLK